MRSETGGEELFTIREVFYSDKGIIGWTEQPIAPQGETLEELQAELARMLEATNQPVLDEAELEAQARAKENDDG